MHTEHTGKAGHAVVDHLQKSFQDKGAGWSPKLFRRSFMHCFLSLYSNATQVNVVRVMPTVLSTYDHTFLRVTTREHGSSTEALRLPARC